MELRIPAKSRASENPPSRFCELANPRTAIQKFSDVRPTFEAWLPAL